MYSPTKLIQSKRLSLCRSVWSLAENPDYLTGVVFLDLNKNGLLDPTDKKNIWSFRSCRWKIATTNAVGECKSLCKSDTETKLSVTYRHPTLDKILPARKLILTQEIVLAPRRTIVLLSSYVMSRCSGLYCSFTAKWFTPTATVTVVKWRYVTCTDFDLSLHKLLYNGHLSVQPPVAQSTTDSILWSNISLDRIPAELSGKSDLSTSYGYHQNALCCDCKTHPATNEARNTSKITPMLTLLSSVVLMTQMTKLVYPESLAPGLCRRYKSSYILSDFQNTKRHSLYSSSKDTLQG